MDIYPRIHISALAWGHARTIPRRRLQSTAVLVMHLLCLRLQMLAGEYGLGSPPRMPKENGKL